MLEDTVVVGEMLMLSEFKHSSFGTLKVSMSLTDCGKWWTVRKANGRIRITRSIFLRVIT